MDLKTALTLLVTVCLALSGYFYSLFLARRKDKLDRINRQLSDFYGPLYALSMTGEHVWKEFRNVHRPYKGSYWKKKPPMSNEDAQAFRLWIRSVFMPLNRQMMDLVVNRADLLKGTEIPGSLLELCAHISSYEALLVQWEKDDFTTHEPIVNYPRGPLFEYAREEFCRLKHEQDLLLNAPRIPFRMLRRGMMNDNSAIVIKAAGGVIFRTDGSGNRIFAVIHKREYDEWCLPKGKVQSGEDWKDAAIREVNEETGSVGCVLGPKAVNGYLVKGVPKIVVYFAMEASASPTFTPSHEVDRAEWLDEMEVRGRLSHLGELRVFDEIIKLLPHRVGRNADVEI